MDGMKREMLQSVVNCMKQVESYNRDFCDPDSITAIGKATLRLAKAFQIVAGVKEASAGDGNRPDESDTL